MCVQVQRRLSSPHPPHPTPNNCIGSDVCRSLPPTPTKIPIRRDSRPTKTSYTMMITDADQLPRRSCSCWSITVCLSVWGASQHLLLAKSYKSHWWGKVGATLSFLQFLLKKIIFLTGKERKGVDCLAVSRLSITGLNRIA